jgi:hypothetical protein
VIDEDDENWVRSEIEYRVRDRLKLQLRVERPADGPAVLVAALTWDELTPRVWNPTTERFEGTLWKALPFNETEIPLTELLAVVDPTHGADTVGDVNSGP